MQVSDEITWRMRSLGLSRADLAARMGVSQSRVSQVLSGGEDFTLRTLAGVAVAIGARLDVHMGDDDCTPHAFGQHPPENSPGNPAGGVFRKAARIWPTQRGYLPDL
jgi:transcriptional regulator with XRE-family HTH domain